MPKSPLPQRLTSPTQEDYLRALHGLAGDSGQVSTSDLAENLGLSSASVSEMLGKLADRDLVVHDHYHGASLTTSGAAIAVEMVRHHRLLETYLVEALGYSWDEVHEEADRLEHVISEKLEQRMWEALGRPQQDPHGHPIPTPDGRLPRGSARPLHELPVGSRLKINWISDRDPDKLRAVDRLGLRPGSRVDIVEASRWEGPVELDLLEEPPAGSQPKRISVPLGLARAVFVEGLDG